MFTADELTLYAIFLVMVVVAFLFVVPTLSKVSKNAHVDRESETHKRALREALKGEYERLQEEKRLGSLTEAEYRRMEEDIERRALEEASQIEANTERKAYSPAVVIASAAALIAVVTIMGYGLKGSPELMRLADSQKVLEGKADIPQLELYLKDNHKDGRAWVLLARKRAEKDDFEGAIVAYRTAREVMTKVRQDPDVALEMAAALVTTRDKAHLKEALPLLENLHTLTPSDLRVTQLLVMTATEIEEWKVAADTVESLLTNMSPDNPQYMEAREMLDRLRQMQQRVEKLEKLEAQKQSLQGK